MSLNRPSNIINFSYYSEQEDQTFKGVFKLRRISVFGANEIQIIGNRLTQGLGVSNTIHAELVRYMAVIGHMVEEVIDGGNWYHIDDLVKTWKNIYDMELLTSLHKEVIAYDEWFRLRNFDKKNKEGHSEESEGKPKFNSNSVDGMGRKKPQHEQEESGVSEVVIG